MSRGFLFTIVFLAWTTLNCLWYAPLLLFTGPIGKHMLRYFRSVAWLERHVLGLTYEVVGTLPAGAPVLIAMKHQSAWETMKLLLLFDDPAVVMKQELKSLPIWGALATRMRPIFVDRRGGSQALKQMIADAMAAIAAGRSIIIFPQGTRVAPGEAKPYRIGVMRLYEITGLPIVPIALNSGLFWPKGLFGKRPGKITLEVLATIPPGLPLSEAMRQLETSLEQASNRLSGVSNAA